MRRRDVYKTRTKRSTHTPWGFELQRGVSLGWRKISTSSANPRFYLVEKTMCPLSFENVCLAWAFVFHYSWHVTYFTCDTGSQRDPHLPHTRPTNSFQQFRGICSVLQNNVNLQGKVLHVTLKENMQQKTLSRKVGYQEFLVYLSLLKCHEKYNTSHGTILRNHLIS